MHRYTSIVALFVGVLTIGSMATTRADFVQNGSFEDVQIGSPYYSLNLSDVPGWTHSGTFADAVLFNTHYTDGGGTITVAGDGNQFAVIGKTTGTDGVGSLSQTLTGLTAGNYYTLNFKIASLFPTASQTIQVDFTSGSSTAAQLFTAEPSSSAYYKTWDSESMTFLATSSSVALRFSEHGQHDTGLDSVSVTESDSAVPEPVFYQMSALLALGSLGILRTRRRK